MIQLFVETLEMIELQPSFGHFGYFASNCLSAALLFECHSFVPTPFREFDEKFFLLIKYFGVIDLLTSLLRKFVI